jgi:phage/plasmid-associated DNA primase
MHTQFSYYEQFWVEVLLAYACLRNSNYLKLIIFLLGVQDSGKTQILNALEHAMGTYAGSFEVTMLRGKYSAGPRPDVVRSMLRRVVITTEAGTDANKGMALAADHLKRLSGNDVISARMLFKSTYLERVPCFTCLIGLNSMPVISGADLATKRRTIVIPFSVSTPAEKQITDMTERLRGEADGILARLVQRLAFEEVLSDVPPRFAETTTHAFAQSSDIQEFLDIMTEETGDPNDIVGNDDLLNAYRSYCEQMNIQPSNQLNMRELGMQLSGLGWKSEQEWYQGRKQRIRRGRKLQLVAEGAAAFLRSMNM